ncbi:ABC transporter permease [Bacillaceae bacterium]
MRTITAYLRQNKINLNKSVILLVPVLIFTLFLLLVGVDPVAIYTAMFQSTFGDLYGFGEVIIKTTPFVLTALATALPARVGLINVGAEGQLAIGALFTTWIGVFYLKDLPGIVGIPILFFAGAMGGALWSAVATFLKVKGGMNETITTLLMNYIAFFIVGHFVHGILKDPESFNWPFSPQLSDALRLPTLPGTRIHFGILLAIGIAILVWLITTRTRLGFRLRVVGGNPVAARQAGLNVGKVQLWTMIAAGAIAGIAGMIEITGIEGRLRPTTGVNYGYLGFLAAWMAWNHKLWLILTSFIIGAISVAGNAMEINSGLPSSSVQILMALVLLAILALGGKKV